MVQEPNRLPCGRRDQREAHLRLERWNIMEKGLKSAGYVGMDLPMEFKLKPHKGHHVVQMIRRGAIVEAMEEVGHHRFLQMVDSQMKTGDHVHWEEGSDKGVNSIDAPMTEPDFEKQIDIFSQLTLPDELEVIVKKYMETIATTSKGRHVWAKIEEGFGDNKDMFNMRRKSHTDALKKGFPSYTQRWFERPIYRYQQTLIGLGPFFATGVKMRTCRRMAARLQWNTWKSGFWNGWTRECMQGRPIAPIGVIAANFAEEDRHKMFVNESGLVPPHMPWIIATAVAWMEQYPCASNNVPSIDGDVVDQYGRFLKQGTVDMRFYYLAEGKEVGAMTVHDIWFERRLVDSGKPNEKKKNTSVMIMCTTFTAKRNENPYNSNQRTLPSK
eukprot:3324563-Amphidinium_carterae.2